MSNLALESPSAGRAAGGGVPARRAVVRWAWRLFRREWHQQLLVLALIVVAVAATIVGSATATNQSPPAGAGFGTAQDAASFPGTTPHLAGQIASLEHRFGTVDVIENRTLSIPGSVDTYDLRAQDPHGPFGQPMLSLLSGRFPSGPGQVALTTGVAADLGLTIGDVWHEGGAVRRVVGTVQDPQSLLDEFALVAPGQVPSPTQVTVLFDAHGAPVGANVQRPSGQQNGINPETISLVVLVLGMLLITLVAVGGFTVLAQRRLRSLGMLASLGATDRNVRLVVRTNGVVVGVAGAALGLVVGLVLWFGYRPHLEQSSHHLIGMFALPWVVVVLAVVLAVVATYSASSRPARAITKLPILTALSGRPAPPRQIHRSALLGIVLLVAAFFLLGYSGGTGGGTGSGGSPELLLGLVLLIPGVILLAPFCLSVLARLGRHTTVAVRIALRDLARYRARSGSALAAISIAVLVAVIIATLAASRYGNSLDYAGPNLASNQLIVWSPDSQGGMGGPGTAGPGADGSPSGGIPAMDRSARAIANSLGSRDVAALDTTTAGLNHVGTGRSWDGQVYVATPELLRAFGIKPAEIDPRADILTMRPGISGLSGMQLTWTTGTPGSTSEVKPGSGPPERGPGGSPGDEPPCTPSAGCLSDPVIQQVGALPSGTSAPNTVITEHAVHQLGLAGGLHPAGWLVQSTHPLTAAQTSSARAAAAADGLSVETKNDQPTSAEVINWATVFGVALALAILAMSVGLIRSETAGELRTLAATGASSSTRRALTAATAGALALLGALLGTVAGYIGVIGWLRDNSLNGGISALANVPVANLLVLLVGMPLVATAAAWLLAGREPPAVARQPID